MSLTFWTTSPGGEAKPGSHKANPFFLSAWKRQAPVNAQRAQRAIKRRPRGPVCHRGRTTERNHPILNMCEYFLLTGEKGQSHGWQNELQIIMGDIQHVKSAQQAPLNGNVSKWACPLKNEKADLSMSRPKNIKDNHISCIY